MAAYFAATDKQQVPDGCDQLSKVQLVGGSFGSPHRLVVATALYRQGQKHYSKLFVGDPEPNDPDPYHFSGNAVETLIRNHYTRISMLTGDAHLASRLLSHDGTSTNADHEDSLVIQKIGSQELAGSRVEFRSGASSVESFVGLELSVRKELLSGDLVGLAHRLSQSAATVDNMPLKARDLDDSNGAVVTENDGTALLLKRRGPINEEHWKA
jgi:hypothetical protein